MKTRQRLLIDEHIESIGELRRFAVLREYPDSEDFRREVNSYRERIRFWETERDAYDAIHQ